MVRFKQIFGLKRYFIVVYMWQNKDGISGQGQCSVVTPGLFIDTNNLSTGVEKELDVKLKKFLLLNVMELNRKDFDFYIRHNNELNEKL